MAAGMTAPEIFWIIFPWWRSIEKQHFIAKISNILLFQGNPLVASYGEIRGVLKSAQYFWFCKNPKQQSIGYKNDQVKVKQDILLLIILIINMVITWSFCAYFLKIGRKRPTVCRVLYFMHIYAYLAYFSAKVLHLCIKYA